MAHGPVAESTLEWWPRPLPGSSSFWLTAFSDTPEIDGAFAESVTIPVYSMARYEIGTGDCSRISRR